MSTNLVIKGIKIVRAVNDLDALDILVSENKDRAEPSAVNLAATAAAYEDRFGLSREEIGARMGFTASRVGQLFLLLKHTDRVKALVHNGRLPESTARTMLGLSAERIEEIVAAVEAGAKPRDVLAAVKDAHREKGKRMPRTIAELRALLDSIDSDRAGALANWINGIESVAPEAFLSDEAFSIRSGVGRSMSPEACPMCENGEIHIPSGVPGDEGYRRCPCCGGFSQLPSPEEIAALRMELWKVLGDLQASDGRLADVEPVLRDLIAALPRCGLCNRPATKAYERGGKRWCDAHAPADCPDYPRAEPLRRAMATLGMPGGEA